MKIALDAQLTIGTATGIGEYVRGLGEALRAQNADVVELQEPKLNPWRFDRRVIWDQWVLPKYARASHADLLHCASGTMPLRPPRTRTGGRMPEIVTVHDVAWLRVQTHARWYARAYFGGFALARYRSAARIVVDSAFSRDELLEVFAENAPDVDVPPVDIVYPGVSGEYRLLSRQPERSSILVVGTIEPRKNLGFLIRLLPQLPLARIVAVGPLTPYVDECRALASQLGVADRVELRGYVPRHELLHLYETSTVAAVPSIYEGFGYAAAQALCAGIPVIVSDRSALPEVTGVDAQVLPLENSEAWRGALADALEGSLELAAQRARSHSIDRFAWSTHARRLLEIYREMTAPSV